MKRLLIFTFVASLVLSSCSNKEIVNVCESCENFEEKYIELEKEFQKTKSEYSDLESDYELLKNEYNDLESDYELLESEYGDLESDYELLETEYNNLELTIEAEYVSKISYEFLQEDIAKLDNNLYDLYQFLNEDIAIIKFGEKNTYHSFDCIYSTLLGMFHSVDEVKQITSISEAKNKGYKLCHCNDPFYNEDEIDGNDEYMLRSYVEDNYIHVDDVHNDYIHRDDIDDYIDDYYN